jgi:archaellum component FlaC
MGNLLIQALREGIDPYDIPTAEKIMDMAADEIERLQFELKAAKYEIEHADTAIERLRAALKRIERETGETMLATNHGQRGNTAHRIAKAALEDER